MNFWYYSKQVEYDSPVCDLALACRNSVTEPRQAVLTWKALQHSLGKQV